MKTKIEQILVRELQKLDAKSTASVEPLSEREVKCLDVLIRAYRSYAADTTKPPEPADISAPTIEDLLNGLTKAE
jgi:hypothetical protein